MKDIDLFIHSGQLPYFTDQKQTYSSIERIIKNCSYVLNNGNYTQCQTFIFSYPYFWSELSYSILESIFNSCNNNTIGIMNCCRFMGTYFGIIPIEKMELEKLDLNQENKDSLRMMIQSKGAYYVTKNQLIKSFNEHDLDFEKYMEFKSQLQFKNYIKVDQAPPKIINW